MLNLVQSDLVKKAAIECIEIESTAVAGLRESINQSFLDTINIIYACKGRLVVTGIGKSAIIAQKIVATLNSTGTASIFMHAADAIHGDLGMIQTNDIILCISKSGETPEIKVLIPLVKSMGNTLIALVSNPQSTLAKQADYIVYTPVSKEADPNNLAPTTSTTVQLAMGDAIAVSLLALKGFTTNDFAQFHPGGSLGKQLYLKVRDIYTQNEKPKVNPEADIKEVIVEMTSRRLGLTAVVSENNTLVGVITDGDLRRMLQKTMNLDTLHAKDIMTKNPKTISENALAIEAFKLLKDSNINQILVVRDKEYLGVVHIHDLIKEGMV
jgi:arabinose-5-phosphate isomerase